MIQYPLEAGTTWTWSLWIGSHYSIAGHAEWADKTNELFVSTYSITQVLPLQTKLGTLTCFEINSFTKSNFNQTELKAYYNTTHGFVKLDYLNIDKGRLTLELIKLKSVPSKFKLPLKQFGVNE